MGVREVAQALAHVGRSHPDRRRRWLTAVGVLLAIELVPGPRTLYSAEIPALYSTIAADARPDVRVLELPVGVKDDRHRRRRFGAVRAAAQRATARRATARRGQLHRVAEAVYRLSRVSPKRGSTRGAPRS